MVASCSEASSGPVDRRPIGAEAAFRAALTDSLEALALGDRNMLRFHYFHGLGVDQLADVFCSPRAAVIRQLARIRERVLRDITRGLTARLAVDKHVDKHELDHLVDRARSRLDLAITRVLRA